MEIAVFIQISSRFVPKGPINIKPTFVQIMAWLQNRRQAFSWTNGDPVPWGIYMQPNVFSIINILDNDISQSKVPLLVFIDKRFR